MTRLLCGVIRVAVAVVLMAGVRSSPAQVVINEFVAAPSSRLIHRAAGEYPRAGITTPWQATAYDDSLWEQGPGPFGFGLFNGVTLGTDLSSTLQNRGASLYLRKTFIASTAQAASGATLQLVTRYNDGFIAFINGVEVARRNMGNPGMFAFHDQTAFNAGAQDPALETMDLGAANTRLVAGTNVLCVQTHNKALTGTVGASLLIQADLRLSGGATLVQNTEAWRYFPGLVEPSGGVLDYGLYHQFLQASAAVAWASRAFNDATWPLGPGPVGTEAKDPPDYILGVNLYAQTYNLTPTIYMRRAFTLTPVEAGSVNPLRLTVDYDDGVILYLNGREVFRRNVGTEGVPAPHNLPATASHNADGDNNGAVSGKTEVVFLGSPKDLLVAGDNVLAVQLHNVSTTSSDSIARVTLETTGVGARILHQPTDAVRYFVGLEEPVVEGEDEEDTGPLEEPPDAESDWIELHNLGASTVSLAGWSLTDDAGDLRKWMFPMNAAIPARGYLLVLATGLDTSPAAGATHLHANFSLATEGEYLALVNAAGQVVSELAPAYPSQDYQHSYGRDASGQYGFFATATPGATNAGARLDPAPAAPDFSVAGGFHEGAVSLALSSTTAGATLRYTLDGTEPNPGLLYTGPINITVDRVVRAHSIRTGAIPSPTITHTYLLNETTAKKTLPALCLSADPTLTLYGPNAAGGPATGEGVLAIKGGIYDTNNKSFWIPNGDTAAFNMPMQSGRAAEKPAALEYFPIAGIVLRTDFGLRAAGSTHTRSRYLLTDNVGGRFTPNNNRLKPSLNLMFRPEWGERPLEYPFFPDSTVTRFRDLRVRAGKNDVANPFIKDELIRRLFLGTGQQGSIGVFNTLYINGVFKGYYNLCERLREGFMQEHYHSSEAWDVQQVNVFSSGDPVHWNKMITHLRAANLADPAAYQQVHDYLDVDNFIDYLMLNAFAAMWDWPNNNWVAARERSPQGRWRFYVWDAEGAFGAASRTTGYNSFTSDLIIADAQTTANKYIPALYTLLKVSPEFQLRFADRVQKHFFNGGCMVKTNMEAIYFDLRDTIRPILEETLGSSMNQGFFNTWIASDTRRSNYFGQLAAQNLWPGIAAPGFNSQGGSVAEGFQLEITNLHGSGTVYFTLDGADPRVYGTGGVSPSAQAYSLPVPVIAATHVRARVRLGGGMWSPMVEAVLYPPQDLSRLALTEIMYHPPDLGELSGNDLEFLELKNTGTNDLNLSGLTFTSGINFSFPYGTVLAPGEFFVLARNAVAFAYKYPGVPVHGTYTGQLDNGGEQIKLSHVLGTPVFSVTYDDRPDWPVAPDVADFSLVQRGPVLSQAPDKGNRWRASTHPGGSPGADDPAPIIPGIVINELLTHTDLPQKDAIELHNPTTNSVNLSGWWLTDDATVPAKFRIPDGTVIPAGGYLHFDQDDFNPTPGLGTSFALSSTGDDVHLFSASTNGTLTGYSHSVEVGASFNGVSFGLHANSAGDEHWPQQTAVTLSLPNAGPKTGPVVISEIHYHPEIGGDEFVELLNITGNAVPLFHATVPTNTWRLNGADFTFPTNVTLAANTPLVVVATNPAVFRAKYNVPTNILILGPYAGQLQDDGENVALQAPDNPNPDSVPLVTVDAVRYNDKAPWPAAADGGGMSLQRVPVMAFGDEPAHWVAADPTPGQATANGDFDGDGMPDAWEMQHGTSPLIADGHLDADGDGLTNWQECQAGTNPNDAASTLKFHHAGVSGGGVTMQFFAVSNRTYSVLHKQALTDPGWLNWTTVPSHPTNRMVTLTNAASEASRFYRLALPAGVPIP